MKIFIVDKNEIILSEHELDRNDSDFELLGSGGIKMPITTPGVPFALLLLENGRILGSGLFGRDITISKQEHYVGDIITIQLRLK